MQGSRMVGTGSRMGSRRVRVSATASAFPAFANQQKHNFLHQRIPNQSCPKLSGKRNPFCMGHLSLFKEITSLPLLIILS